MVCNCSRSHVQLCIDTSIVKVLQPVQLPILSSRLNNLHLIPINFHRSLVERVDVILLIMSES
jgi:hypothetical protein